MWGRWTAEIGVGTPELISAPKSFKDSNGITHPAAAFTLWTSQELADVGWYSVVQDTIPVGEQLVSKSYNQVGLEIIETFVTEPIPEMPLDQFKEISLFKINIDAQDAKNLWLELTPGNLIKVQAQKREIDRWATDGAPTPNNYPWAKAQAARVNKVIPPSVDNTMIQGIVDTWKDEHTLWEDNVISIEDIKERAIEDINAALTNAEVQAVLDAIVWPTPI